MRSVHGSVAIAVVVVMVLAAVRGIDGRFVMPWICANQDICGNDWSIVKNQAKQLGAKSDGQQVFTDAAFENYGLSGDGELVKQQSALPIADDIRKQGVRTWAMSFSTDLEAMRAAWKDERSIDRFLASFNSSVLAGPGGDAVQGLNLDWEPNGSPTSEDSTRFAQLLGRAADHLHKMGMLMSVAGIRDAAPWNYKLIAKTSVDYVMDMNTYMDGQDGNPEPTDFPYFKQQVNACLAELRKEQYVVCIEDNLTLDELQDRIKFMQSQGVHQFALWLSNLASPLPEKYFPYFAKL